VDDVAVRGARLETVGLVRCEVPGVLVDLDPGAQPGHVQFGVELGRVDVGTDPERLHRAGGGAGQQRGVARQLADRLLVPGEGAERPRQLAQQRIVPAVRREGDLDIPDRLGVAPVNHGALMTAERADAVARAEEREVRVHHGVEHPADVGLDLPLYR
jgi:hypothetical protein